MRQLKYIFLLPVVTMLLGLGAVSCSDNTDFSSIHTLTDDELAELARQQARRDSLLSIISADSVVFMDVNLIASESSYDGGTLLLDYGAAAATFGLTEEQTFQAIENLYLDDDTYKSGYPEFTAFAIDGSTHNDNLGAQTQVGDYYGWGHWFDSKGDVCEWNYANNDEAVFTSIYTNYADFASGTDADRHVTLEYGQYPGMLYDGQVVTVIEALSYTDENEVTFRVAYVLTVTVGVPPEIEGSTLATYDVDGDVEYNASYTTTDIPFDLPGLISTLGAPSFSDIQWVALKADGSYYQEQDAWDANGNGGFWFGQDGYYGGYNDASSVYVCFPTDEYIEAFTAAPMPDVFTVGSEVTVHAAAVYNSNIVEYNIHITIVEPAEITASEVYTAAYTVVQAYRSDWSASLLTIDADAICSALGISNITEASKVTLNNGKYATDGDAAGSGFWYDLDGNGGVYSMGNLSIFVTHTMESDPTEQGYSTLSIGMYPYDDPSTLTPVTVHYGFMANDKIAMLTINWSLGDEDSGFSEQIINTYEGEIVQTLNFSVEIPYSDYDWYDNTFEFDHTSVLSALGISSMYETGLKLIGKNANGEYDAEHTSNTLFWYDYNGDRCTYGDTGFSFYLEYYGTDEDNNAEYPEDLYTIYYGACAGGAPAGTKANCEFGFYYNKKIVWVVVEFSVIEGESEVLYDPSQATTAYTETVNVNANDFEENMCAKLFDSSLAMSALGVNDMLDVTFYTLVDGQYYYGRSSFTANWGWWYDGTGGICYWGADNCAYGIEYWGQDADNLTDWPEDIGYLYFYLYDGSYTPTISYVVGFCYGDKKAELTVNFGSGSSAAKRKANMRKPSTRARASYKSFLKKMHH